VAARVGRRLCLRDKSVRAVLARVAGDAWRRSYYADQANRDALLLGATDPGAQDILDTLELVAGARAAIEGDELVLIAYARQHRISWERIGLALGYRNPGARQSVRDRYARLGGDPKEAQPGSPGGSWMRAPALFDVDPDGSR
jgi:hypothetical protein